MEAIRKVLQTIREKGLYPEIKIITGPSNLTKVTISGKEYHHFSSANYLGLANDERVNQAVIMGIKKYGIHPSGARLLSGTLDIHKELEKKIAEFKHSEGALIFSTGTMANIGVIPALMSLPVISAISLLKKKIIKKDACIFSDSLNHATIIDGCRLAKNAERVIYKHRDMADLEKCLRLCRKKRKLIVTDGVFSMNGDIAPLPKIIELSKKYNTLLMVDDAHASGVLGKMGEGTLEHFNLPNEVDISMGTFSKAFGVLGGFIAGKKDIIDYLQVTARTFIFTGAFPPALVCGILKSLEIIQSEGWRREKLWEMSDYFREKLQQMGFDTLGSETPIIPILIGEEKTAIAFADDLFSKGILAPCARWPAVAKGKSIIRFSLTSEHSYEQINYVLEITKDLGKKHKLIQ